MPSFWSFIGNEHFDIGCTGQAVYLYDKSGTEIAKFKDISYAYTAAICPTGDMFVVKSTEGRLAAYSFDPPTLLKKFRFSKVDGAQDDGFCFSPDGTEFYNIERHGDSCKTALSIYDAGDFSLKRRILEDDLSPVLSCVECEAETGELYLMGFTRGDSGVAEQYFVAKRRDDALEDLAIISKKDFVFYQAYIALRMKGFSKKAYEWSYIGVPLQELKSAEYSLAKLWRECHT